MHDVVPHELALLLLTQALEQTCVLLGHPQLPVLHCMPPMHGVPQLPQLALSVCVLVQVLPQRFGSAPPQLEEHCPPEQSGRGLVQTFPQAPQLCSSPKHP